MPSLNEAYTCGDHTYMVIGWIESVVYLYGGPIECVEMGVFNHCFRRVL